MENKILRELEVRKIAGNVGASTLRRWVKAGIFPAPRKIGPRAKGWPESEVAAWVSGEWKREAPAGNRQ